jgi:ATP-binding cassette, subfamily B, multidrug efflux pump
MLKLIKYFKPYSVLILLTLFLLFGQAMAELSLPEYLSKIVNVGIQQKGIHNAVPESIRSGEMEKIFLFMNEQDIETVKDHYVLLDKSKLDASEYQQLIEDYPSLAQESIYILDTDKQSDINKLNNLLGRPIMIVANIEVNELTEYAPNEYVVPTGVDPFAYIASLTEEDYRHLMNLIDEKTKMLPQSIITQSAISYIAEEYKEAGVDVNSIQNTYILHTGGIMLLYALLGAAAAISVGFISARIAAGFARNIRLKIFEKVERYSNIEFDKFSTASLITRTTNDITQIQMIFMMMFRSFFYAPIIGIGAIVKALGEDVSLLWLIGAAVFVMVIMIATIFSISHPRFKLMQKLVDKLSLKTREMLSGLMVIRAFNAQRNEEEKFDKTNVELTKLNMFVNLIMVAMMPGMMLLMNGTMLGIIWFGARQVDFGTIQVGSMMAFMQYAMQVIMAFMMMSMAFNMLPRANVSANRIAEVLETGLSILDPPSPQSFDPDIKGKVEFRKVSFKYPDADEYVLKDISFKAEPGQTIAFIGGTGSGKSTLINLIPRFYDVTDGNILVNDTDIRTVTQHDLREKIGYVPQRNILFSGTIESNIKYGDETACEEEVKTAARIAQASEFIDHSADGLHMSVAQGGMNLSGGQKQRLSIARALARKPEIFILDDSFSALDFRTDAALRRALKSEIKDSTVLIVAQRISTIMNADQIIVLDQGRIVGIGKHRDLMEKCDVYREIALSQLSKEELA